MPQVMVISSEGYFYSYNIDLENGGECSLLKQYRYAFLHRNFFHNPDDARTSLLDSNDETANE